MIDIPRSGVTPRRERADVPGVSTSDLRRHEGGSIMPVEAFVLGVIAAIVVAIGIPSYLAMQGRSSDAAARSQVRQAADAVEEYRAAHGSLAGVTPATLRRYDPELAPSSYRLSVTSEGVYCVESSARGREWRFEGPAGSLERGACL